MKTIGDTVEEIIKAGRYSTGTIIDKVAGYEVPPDFSPSLVNALANTLAAACEKLDKSRARIEQLEAALREAILEHEDQADNWAYIEDAENAEYHRERAATLRKALQ